MADIKLSRNANVPNVLVITDIAHDYDDAASCTILAHLHKEGKINFVGAIATLRPEMERAKIALYLLQKYTGVMDVAVAVGTEGTKPPEKGKEDLYKLKDYEKIAEAQKISDKEIRKYLDFTSALFKNAKDNKTKIHLLSIGGHRDVWGIIEHNKAIFPSVVSQIHIQGGCKVYEPSVGDKKYEDTMNDATKADGTEPGDKKPKEKTIILDLEAANNTYDMAVSRDLYAYLQKQPEIATKVYRNKAAFALQITPNIFDVDNANEVLLRYLKNAHAETIKNFFHTSRNPQWPHQSKDREWFILTRLVANAPDSLKADLRKSKGKEFTPEQAAKEWEQLGKAVLKYSAVVFNDPLATIGCVGLVDDDVLRPEKVMGLTHFLQVGEQINAAAVAASLRQAVQDALKA